MGVRFTRETVSDESIFLGDYYNRGMFFVFVSFIDCGDRSSVVLSEEEDAADVVINATPATNSIIGAYFGRWVIFRRLGKVSLDRVRLHICRRGHIARLPRRGRVHQLLPAKNVSSAKNIHV